MDQPSDAQIIASSLNEPERFEVLFDRHFDALHRYLARRIGPQLAEDLAAATFVEAFRHRDRFDASVRDDARPWLFGIAVNMLRGHRRAEARQLAAYSRIREGAPQDEIERADERMDAEVIAAEALAELMPDDRDTLLLFVWVDLSHEEVAEALQIPIGTVKSRLNRARRHIRERLHTGSDRDAVHQQGRSHHG